MTKSKQHVSTSQMQAFNECRKRFLGAEPQLTLAQQIGTEIHATLEMTSTMKIYENFLNEHLTQCGLNADWSVQAWHIGPSNTPNMESGDLYILDLEDDSNMFELVLRTHTDDPDDNDEIETLAVGTPADLYKMAQDLLKEGA